jgi:acyl-CoA synthetase (AMP-forming)/AMP-acid ligase II
MTTMIGPLRRATRVAAERTAVTCGELELTYAETWERCRRLVGALQRLGVDPADRVAVVGPNCHRYLELYQAVPGAGMAIVPLNQRHTDAELRYALEDSGARVLFAGREVRDLPGCVEHVIDLRDGYEELLASAQPAGFPDDVDEDRLAGLFYTGGTTGASKGVMLTHRNLVANVAQIRPLHGMVADDVVLAVLPFFHSYGLTVLLNAALHARARLVIMPSFDLGDFLGNIQNHKCTIAFIAPPVAVALAKHPLVDSYDLSSLNTIMCGAAPLDADLGQAVAKRLGCRMVQGYGMSEVSPVSHITPFDGGQRLVGTIAPLSSVGWTVSNAACKLVDPETGNEIDVPAEGLSKAGELWFKGPNVMAGYLGNEQATRETIDADGWLHTGDLARVDANGCVYIVDRLKELIKYKGYQVPPAELEAVLLSHPGIADAAVIGVSDDEGEEVPKAFVVKQSGEELTADEVMEFVAGQVAPYKKVRQVEFIESIPKSASGKILRKDLRTV